jgi:hypothetical protein
MAAAYDCFKAPAYRADLFRFCALWAEGGVYLDSDLHLMHPLHTLYRPCANLSVGHDWPKGAVQMKIIASIPGHAVAECMVRHIFKHVSWRYVPKSSLALSGPELLGECVRYHSSDVVFTHIDTRSAAWPYGGLRSSDTLFAFEEPNVKRHWKNADKEDYSTLFGKRIIYRETCAVPRVLLPPPPPSPPPPPPPPPKARRSFLFARPKIMRDSRPKSYHALRQSLIRSPYQLIKKNEKNRG